MDYREKEKKILTKNKENLHKLKIWDKKTASTKNPLRSFKNFGVADGFEEKDSRIGAREIAEEETLLKQAMDIVNERKKERDNLRDQTRKRETIRDVVDQKKDIFLVTMTTEIIKKERENLKNKIRQKNEALAQ